MSRRDQTLLERAKRRWKQWADADSKQLEREREDLSFYQGEGQWPADIKADRDGRAAKGDRAAVPARPCLTINKTREPIRYVVASIRQSDLGVEVVPADDFGPETNIGKEEIELREGLMRRIQRQSEAQDARMWAADRAVKAGRGYYGLMTRYVSGKSMDQEVYYRRFYDQSCVALDPAHEMPDGSDAEWAFVKSPMRWTEYVEQYGDAKGNDIPNWESSEWSAACESDPDWFEGDEDTRVVIIREHWYTERKAKELYELPDGSVVWEDELPDGIDTEGLKHRTEVVKTVHFCKLDGRNVLEQAEWPSKFIPIIKVVGEEIQPFDEERRAEGMVRPAREPGQGYNYMVSAMVETIGLAPKVPWVAAAGQFEGFEASWDQSNVRNIGRLEYNPVVDGVIGQVLPPPQRQAVEPPIQAISQAVMMFDGAIKSTTGIPDPTLGNVDPSLKSGRAIKTLLDQAKQGSSSYLDNVIVSARYEAKILNSLLAPIYGRPGRLVRLMTSEGQASAALVGVPYVLDGEGESRPIARAFDPSRDKPDDQHQAMLTDDVDWNIAVKVTKQYDTRREEQLAQVTDMVNNAPELMLPVIGDLLFKYDDGPAAKEIAERLKLTLAPAVQESLSGKAPVPPEVQQQLTAAQEGLSVMQAQLQQAQEIINARQIESAAKLEQQREENAAKLQQQQIEAASRERIALIQASASLANTQAKIDSEDARAYIDAIEERIAKQLDLRLAQLDHARESVEAAMPKED